MKDANDEWFVRRHDGSSVLCPETLVADRIDKRQGTCVHECFGQAERRGFMRIIVSFTFALQNAKAHK